MPEARVYLDNFKCENWNCDEPVAPVRPCSHGEDQLDMRPYYYRNGLIICWGCELKRRRDGQAPNPLMEK